MSFAGLQTPQKPLPGAFLQTPAPSRYQSGGDFQRQLFPSQPSSGQLGAASQSQNSGQGQQLPQASQPQTLAQAPPLSPVQRAARTINEFQLRDARFPDIDSYVKQGISSDYDLPTSDAWAPFQKSKMYDIPDKIFEQYNHAQVSTMMGLFAELNHAWITIDNCLYLWDYTQTNPELIGFEEQPNSITAIKLVVPRPGVFVPTITHVLVVATTLDMLLLGVSVSQGPTGIRTISLYQTRMSLSVKGIDVRVIEGSSSTGRIFFAGGGDNEVYELTYQQEEKWFANRCGKVNHTSPGYTSLVPTSIWAKKSPEHIVEMVIDDSRNLLYTLSSESAIRTFHMDSPVSLQKTIEKTRNEVLRDISHMMSLSPLLGDAMRIMSISPIPSNESAKLHLMAITSTGCRLFLSATRGYSYIPDSRNPPTSMQVQHIKFPPREQQPPKASGQQQVSYQSGDQALNTSSRSLEFSRRGLRYPPGLFLCFVTKASQSGKDILFLSAPDTGRIAAQSREAQGSKYYEQALWHDLNSVAEAVGLVTRPFSAAAGPVGFGNELSVQFDMPSTEIAILTNTGIHTFRRRRLVDIFAAAIRNGGGDEGLEGEMRRFIRQYGRGEATAAALAVACGQGADLSSTDFRAAKVTDPVTLDLARKAFVEFGGKPVLNDNAITDGSVQAVDNVRPSARHEGLALYISRLVRSIWKAEVILQESLPGGAVAIKSRVSTSKLRSVQDDLSKLDKFLDNNSTFIEGLNGAEGLSRAASKNEETALQGEHQALNSLQVLIKSTIEGISFVIMLFDERVDELWASLDDMTRQRLRNLTYESLFASNDGTDLGKVLVKAIVTRNIANGSNVDTVADALRRKCKSFCSAEDVDVFRAQEQLKRASEIGPSSDVGRKLLNGSLHLFEGVAGSLSFPTLQGAIQQYVALEYYAGAIQLALKVAQKLDSGNRALHWYNDGKPDRDPRADLYEKRNRCYKLVHDILVEVDASASRQLLEIDGRPTIIARKRAEAHAIVNSSEDELFQYNLYEWYLSQGWIDRLHDVQTPYMIAFLEGKSRQLEYRDLLWQYYAKWEQFFDAAVVQLTLAKNEDLNLTLQQRIEYLSRSKANSSTTTNGVARQARQVLSKEVSDLLEVADIQDDIFQRLRVDKRLDGERKLQVIEELGGKIRDLTDLYNGYADQAGFFDDCLLIYHAADHRNPADIEATWQGLIVMAHNRAEEEADEQSGPQQPYEAVVETIRTMAPRLGLSEILFPPTVLVPMVERYAFENQRGVGPSTWVVDVFLEVGIPHANLLSILEQMFYNDEAPFQGQNRRALASEMLTVIKKWYLQCRGSNQTIFGGAEVAHGIGETLVMLMRNGLSQAEREEAEILRAKIEREFQW